jgi:magnesium-transporting ATPase (P-type)
MELPPALRPLALVALRDELRPDAGRTLDELAAGGVRLVLLSGDHPETVRATVAHVSPALANAAVHTGAELAAAADPDRLVADAAVFGRVAPHQKLDVITSLQRGGRRVAMIGDGVNDVLAIKTADLGVAMGAGTPAAKTVAGLVLESNRFALLPAALAEGRTVVHNVRRAANLFLVKNVYTLLLVLVLVGLLGFEFPYLPQQVTLLNALTIGGPAILIMLGTAPPGAAVRPAFLRAAGRFALLAGLPAGLAALAVFLAAAWGFDAGPELRRTLLLSTLVLVGVGNVVRVGEGDHRLTAWAALAVPAYLLAMYVPPVGYFFALVPLSAAQWAAVAVAAAAGYAAGGLSGRR